MKSKNNFKNIILISLLLVILMLFIFEIYAFYIVQTSEKATIPPNFGNFERVRNLLKDCTEEFSFALAGDINGRGTFEKICRNLREEPLSFMVILGDAVRKPTYGYHRFFKLQLQKELSLPFPTFYVAGNHDVDKKNFTVNDFEKDYGPTNFSFEYGNCLFIVLRIIGKPFSTDESLKFLEDTLKKSKGKYRKTFLFFHIPPPVSNDFFSKHYENQWELMALINDYKVDYVATGDYHGYARVKVKNTNYLITGGGGSHLRDMKFGNFHHAIVIKVGENSISERILAADRVNEFEDGVERYVIAEYYPWVKNNLFLFLIFNIGILLFLLGLLWKFFTGRIYK